MREPMVSAADSFHAVAAWLKGMMPQADSHATVLVFLALVAALIMRAATYGHGVRGPHDVQNRGAVPHGRRGAPHDEPPGRTTDGGASVAVPESTADREAPGQDVDASTSFVHMAAHELSKPMTPVVLAARMLRTSLDRPEVAGHHLEILERGVDRIRRLLDDLLVAARLQDQRLPVTPAALDLRMVTAEIASGYTATAHANGVHLELAHPDEPVLAYADPARVAQVVANLVDNAIKYTPRGGRIMLRVAAAPGGGTIEVADTGIGMTAEQQARLFQPFARVHDHGTESRPGTGLGLYLAKGLVEAQGGTIACRSAGRGQGTTFVVHLPDVLLVDDPDDVPGARSPQRPGGPRTSVV